MKEVAVGIRQQRFSWPIMRRAGGPGEGFCWESENFCYILFAKRTFPVPRFEACVPHTCECRLVVSALRTRVPK